MTSARLPPHGFVVTLAADTVVCDGGETLFSGSSGRIVHLKAPARDVLGDSREVVVSGRRTARVARLLLDRGLANPRWEGEADETRLSDVTAVVPAHGRADQVRRLLAALPPELEVVVVDDGTPDPGTLADVVSGPGRRLLRRDGNGGPAAARNLGLRAVRTPFVAFLDSDVVPTASALARLRRHFDDPAVGIVGPRVRGLHEAQDLTWLGRYEAARSSLDLGPQPGLVRPHTRIGYLPSAALMARVAALGNGFEESMQVAEDVDLIWRVDASGWQVRYEPDAVVRHEHRTDTAAWFQRKAFYGTGAASLAARHGDAVAPMVLTPWTATLVVALLAQRRWSLPVGLGATAVALVTTSRRLSQSSRPVRTAAAVLAPGAVGAAYQTMSALTRHYWPVAAVAALVSPRARRALAVAAVLDSVLDQRRTRPDLDPVRFFVARRLDDLAYGSGVWLGAWRARSPRALVPAVRGLPRGLSQHLGRFAPPGGPVPLGAAPGPSHTAPPDLPAPPALPLNSAPPLNNTVESNHG